MRIFNQNYLLFPTIPLVLPFSDPNSNPSRHGRPHRRFHRQNAPGSPCAKLARRDDCFHCGEKITTPYLYWQGAPKGVSLHQNCALKVALGLIQDAHERTKGKPPESERDAALWLDLFASKKEYGIEDEELRLS